MNTSTTRHAGQFNGFFIQFVSSGMGVASYSYAKGDQRGRIEYRYESPPYEHSHTNLSRAQYRNEIEDSLGILHCGISIDPIPDDLVDAFNQFRQDQHDQYLRWLESRPEMDNFVPNDDPSRNPLIPPLQGGHYDVHKGCWIRNTTAEISDTAHSLGHALAPGAT